MRILYDGQIFSKQNKGGINRYFQNLIAYLPLELSPIVSTLNDDIDNVLKHPRIRFIRYLRKGFPLGTLSLWFEKYYFRIATKRYRPSIIHPTYYYSLSQHYVSKYKYPVVITVYDMIHEKILNVSPDAEIIKRKNDSIQRADAIICISENTKRDLLEYHKIDQEKVFVTPLASEIEHRLSFGDESVPEKPYFLYIGYRGSYKNYTVLMEAFSKVAPQKKDIVLAVVGAPFSDDEIKRMIELKIYDRVIPFGEVDDKHLAKLYRCSTALVYPSLYEGFGIPLIEAMACKTVVIASNRSSIPEVVGAAGILFDPQKPDDLSDILCDIVDNENRREPLIKKGLERSKLFSWKLTAEKTVNVYNAMI